MPKRKVTFQTGSYYHVYNRGVGKKKIFLDDSYCKYFFDIMSHYSKGLNVKYSEFKKMSDKAKERVIYNTRNDMPVEIVAFCIMPNHFHLLLAQRKDGGVQKFVGNIQNSYARYFNIRQMRKGVLFESRFEVNPIETDEELLQVSRYIELNPVASGLISFATLFKYPWASSCANNEESLCTGKSFIFNVIGDRDLYNAFLKEGLTSHSGSGK